MRCENGCSREVDLRLDVSVKIGEKSVTAYPCNGCGRLHTADGEPVIDNHNNKGYYGREGVFWRDKKGKIVLT
jgi:hypothetical protein